MAPLKLDSVESLPSPLRAQMLERRAVFEASRWLDDVLKDPKVQMIELELEAYLRTRQVVGYHCTREPEPGYFKRHGLRALSLQEHQAWFLATHGHHFTSEEREKIETAWDHYFVGQQVKARQGTLWFCLTAETVCDGTDALFKYNGGEAVHKPLRDEPEIFVKLTSIGRPVVVEASVAGRDIGPHQRLALPALTAFHRTIRSDANGQPSEGRIVGSITPGAVLAVRSPIQFGLSDV